MIPSLIHATSMPSLHPVGRLHSGSPMCIQHVLSHEFLAPEPSSYVRSGTSLKRCKSYVPFRGIPRSSANALDDTCGLFRHCPSASGIRMPLIPPGVSLSTCISERSPCRHSKYRHGDRGHPCAIPFVGVTVSFDFVPFALNLSLVPLYILFTICMYSLLMFIVSMTSNM